MLWDRSRLFSCTPAHIVDIVGSEVNFFELLKFTNWNHDDAENDSKNSYDSFFRLLKKYQHLVYVSFGTQRWKFFAHSRPLLMMRVSICLKKLIWDYFCKWTFSPLSLWRWRKKNVDSNLGKVWVWAHMGDQVEGSKNKIEFSFFSYFLEQKTIFFSEHLPHICAAIHSLRHEKKY